MTEEYLAEELQEAPEEQAPEEGLEVPERFRGKTAEQLLEALDNLDNDVERKRLILEEYSRLEKEQGRLGNALWQQRQAQGEEPGQPELDPQAAAIHDIAVENLELWEAEKRADLADQGRSEAEIAELIAKRRGDRWQVEWQRATRQYQREEGIRRQFAQQSAPSTMANLAGEVMEANPIPGIAADDVQSVMRELDPQGLYVSTAPPEQLGLFLGLAQYVAVAKKAMAGDYDPNANMQTMGGTPAPRVLSGASSAPRNLRSDPAFQAILHQQRALNANLDYESNPEHRKRIDAQTERIYKTIKGRR